MSYLDDAALDFPRIPELPQGEAVTFDGLVELFRQQVGGADARWLRINKLVTRFRGERGDRNSVTDELRRLLQLEAVLRPDHRAAFDHKMIEREVRLMLGPTPEVASIIEKLFELDVDVVVADLVSLHRWAPRAAEHALRGEIRSALSEIRRQPPSTGEFGQRDGRAVIADLARYHVIDALWWAARDASDRFLQPTGFSWVDEGHGDIPRAGPAARDLLALESAIKAYDTLARKRRDRKLVEADLDAFEPSGLYAAAQSFFDQLGGLPLKKVERLIKDWERVGRSRAQHELARLKEHVSAPDFNGRTRVSTVSGVHAQEKLWLALTCNAFWIDPEESLARLDKLMHNLLGNSSIDRPPERQEGSRLHLLLLNLALQSYEVNVGAETLKQSFEPFARVMRQRGKPGWTKPSFSKKCQFMSRRWRRRLDNALPAWDTKANALWNAAASATKEGRPSLEQRILMLESCSRFWLRLHL